MRPFVAGILTALLAPACAPDASDAPASGTTDDAVYQAILEFYEYDVEMSLDAKVVAQRDAPAYLREKVVFSGSRGDRVPAYLMLPKAAEPPFPLVLLIDGWTGSKERWWEENSWPRGGLVTKTLAGKGIAALALDAQYHGERAANLGHLPVDEALCETCDNSRREMIVESIVDHRRALDYLATREEIDVARVGALGHSMGGMMSFVLAAVEPRLDVAVACVTPARPWTKGRSVAPHTFAPRVRVPLLMQMGRRDRLYSEAEARELFGLVAGTEKHLEFYDAGHRLPAEYVPRAVAWLEAELD